MSKFCFDASSLIYFWENYPVENVHFQSLWYNWFRDNAVTENFCISSIAYQEVRHKIPDLEVWFKKNKISLRVLKTLPMDLLLAKKIKDILAIQEDNYGKGVGENDLVIIAIAKRLELTLVSDEKKQLALPPVKKNYKIPAVCSLEQVKVNCINFVELLKRKV